MLVPMPASTVSLAPGTWIADPVHSDISFRVRHMGVGRVRGTFTLASAELTVADDAAAAGGVRAVVDAATVFTGNEDRDRHIRSADFLDVDNHPSIEFASTQVRDIDGDSFALVGDLTLHGVTRTVELAAQYLGTVDDPSGGERAGFTATTTISRAAFEVNIDLRFGAGNVVVADTIEITIDIEFTSERAEQS
jgi:polyisoprenoid-binding protein YceI